MKHGSLFSGIGGFDLAAEWMGWTNVFHVERDPFCQSVLAHHFPNAKTYTDVKTFDGKPFRGHVDILTGGFPCQPYSTAGKRLGKDDERHLWPEMCRIISEVAPAYVVGENVRGLLNWNGGVVFEEVCADLEAMGYEVWTGLIPAAGVGAPHRRDRIWFVAYSEDIRRERAASTGCEWTEFKRHNRTEVRSSSCTNGCVPNATDTSGTGLQRSQFNRGPSEKGSIKREGRFFTRSIQPNWKKFPTEPPVCGGDDGLPCQLDGITFPKWRAESIKAYGNAIVPQVAYQIFKSISQTHEYIIS
jgi:DNA (cytosine-5)-methyltransferase 1